MEMQDLDNKFNFLNNGLEQTNKLADEALKRNEANITAVKIQEETLEARMSQLQKELFHEFGSLRSKSSAPISLAAGPAAMEVASLTA